MKFFLLVLRVEILAQDTETEIMSLKKDRHVQKRALVMGL